MESQKIKILLDSYWEGNSSNEEEAQLLKMFKGDVPADAKKYAVLFKYRELTADNSEGDFDLGFLEGIERAAGSPERKSRPKYVRWGMSAAAAVLLALFSVTYQWPHTQTLEAQGEEIEQAYTETLAALQLVSDKLNKGNASIMELSVFDKTKNHVLHENN